MAYTAAASGGHGRRERDSPANPPNGLAGAPPFPSIKGAPEHKT